MKEKFVRLNAWFTTIFFSIMSICCLFIVFEKKFEIWAVFTMLIFVAIAFSGFSARNFGSRKFRRYPLSKHIAILSLMFGILFVVIAPLIFTNLFGLRDSFKAIVALVIMFIPTVITSLAILFNKSGRINLEIEEKN